MERSYDIFVDNGLYVLEYYLQKDIKDITYNDLDDSISFMGDKVEEFLNCDKYSNLKSMFLFNSTVSNPSLIAKNITLKSALKEFASQKGNEHCMTCGNNYANTQIRLKGRSYLPNRPSSTYFNFANNLHNINICPYCLLLTTYSVMNCRVNETVNIYNSPDDDFMKYYTECMQKENQEDILSKATKPKKTEFRLNLLIDLIVNSNLKFTSDIEIYRFSNGKEEQISSPETLSINSINLIKKLQQNNLLEEFIELELSWLLINNRLESWYLVNIYDFETEQLKCSKDLFTFLNTEINKIDPTVKEITDKLINRILLSDLNLNYLKIDLKNSKNLREFTKEFKRICYLYHNDSNKDLLTQEEYEIVTHRKNYSSVKNLILITLLTKGEEK